MYETQYALLFAVGCLLTIGAWTNRGRGFSAGAGIFVWGVLGFASTALVIRTDSGGEFVYESISIAWLCFANAGMHAIVLVLHLHEVLVDSDDDAQQLDPTNIADDIDTELPQ